MAAQVTIKEKFFMILEVIFIMVFFCLTLIEIYSVTKVYYTYIDAQNKYYFYLVHNRLQMKAFNAYIASKGPNSDCPFHPPIEDKSQTRLSYRPRQIMSLGRIKSANLVDITSTIQVYDKFSQKYIENSTYLGKKYFSFEMQSLGNSTIDFMTNYVFNIWKGVRICALQLYYSSPKAYILVPKPQGKESTINENCKRMTNYDGAQACGIYHDTYQTCSLIKYTSLNSSVSGDQFDSSTWYDQGWTCPFNYFDMNFTYNPSYNFSNPDSMKIDGSSYMQFLNTVDMSGTNMKSKEKHYQSFVDKYLLYDLDNAFVGDYKVISKANDTFDSDNQDSNIYSIGRPYAFKDSFNGIWDTYSFEEFFNDTFYKHPVQNNKTGRITYLPEFLQGSNDLISYLPVDSKQKKLNISLTYWGLPTVSKECFNNFILPNKKWEWFVYLSKLATNFLDDDLPLILAWLLVKLFISFFWQISIRLCLIYEKFSKGRNSQADVKSDYITRYTSKMVSIIVFALLFYGVLYQESYFKNTIESADNINKFNCYSDQLIKDSLFEYKMYTQKLLDLNNLFFVCLFSSLVIEIFTTLIYTIDYFTKIQPLDINTDKKDQ